MSYRISILPRRHLIARAAAVAIVRAAPVRAQSLTGPALVQALRAGGYVLVMRHTSSPRALPDPASANADNPGGERQLDATGQDTARAMGEAFRALHIPVGEVLTSPTYRARQTAAIAALGTAVTADELGDGGQGMMQDADNARSVWLRNKAGDQPRGGANTLLITHAPNILGAFGSVAADIADGETLVFRPAGAAPVLMARVEVEEWQVLAAAK